MAGGYQKPTNPAPVSGPGAMAQRTDGGPSQPTRVFPGGEYGDRIEMMNLQESAPMAQQPSILAGAAPQSQASASAQPPVPLTADTMRPDEPVTQGAPVGPGSGPEILGLGQQMHTESVAMKRMLPVFEQVANSDPDYRSLRLFVQYLKGL